MAAIEAQLGLPRSPLPKGRDFDSLDDSRKGVSEFKGRLVDSAGKPIAGAKVTSLKGRLIPQEAVITGPAGEFKIAADEPKPFLSVSVEASGFAARQYVLAVLAKDAPMYDNYRSVDPSGAIRHALILNVGTEIGGRVLRDRKPVSGFSISLKVADLESMENPHYFFASRPEVVKTDSTGFFRFPHLPPGTNFWVYVKHGGVENGGAISPVRVRTGVDGSKLDLGELKVETGRVLAGRLVCSDGKPVPEDVVIRVGWPKDEEDLEQRPGADGRFEFRGLAVGPISMAITSTNLEVRARYRLSDKNRCLDPSEPEHLEGRLDGDVTDLTLLLELVAPTTRHRALADPTALADFNEAKTGPITGVAPRP